MKTAAPIQQNGVSTMRTFSKIQRTSSIEPPGSKLSDNAADSAATVLGTTLWLVLLCLSVSTVHMRH